MNRTRILPFVTSILLLLIVVISMGAPTLPEPSDPWWDGFVRDGPPGADTTVYSMAVYEGDLIVGGNFTSVAGPLHIERFGRLTTSCVATTYSVRPLSKEIRDTSPHSWINS